MTSNIYNNNSEHIITNQVASFSCLRCGYHIDSLELEAFKRVKCPKCGSIETVPTRFCNFLLLEVLSINSIRSIYKARDESLNRMVAIKIMPKSFSADRKFISKFRAEMRTVAKLNHDNLIQVYSFGVEKGQPYITTELINGEHLDKIIEEHNGIPISTAIRICYDISLGLQEAAKTGIIHENISPGNIILNKFGYTKLASFGLVNASHAVDQKKIQGSPYYISPEQIRRQKLDVRSNIYSLGAAFYHMLSGQPPFFEKKAFDAIIAKMEQSPTDVKILYPEIPDIVSNIVKRMLQPNPGARYPSYKSLLNDLGKAMSLSGDKDDEKAEVTGRKQINYKTSIEAIPIRHTTNNNNKVKQPPPPKIPPTVLVSKHILKQNKHEGKKMLVIAMDHKPTAANRESHSIKRPASNPLTDKEKMRRLHLRQKKSQRSITATVIAISAIIVSISTIFILYRRHEKTQQRIEAFALKKARENSKNIYTKISEDSIYLNEALESCIILRKEIKYALQLLGANPKSLLTNSILVAKGARIVTSKENSSATQEIVKYNIATNYFSFNFKDEYLPLIISNALGVETNINELAAISKEMEILKQGAKGVNAKSLNKTTAAIVKVENKYMRKTAVKSLEHKRSVTATMKDIKTTHAKIVEKTEAHVVEVETRRQAAIEAERQRLEAIRLEQERLAYEALVKSELNQVEIDHAAVGTISILFVSNDFKEIVKTLEENFKSYQTDAGKKSAKLVIDRFNEMVGLKEEIIACINKHTFPWGWGSDLASRDIIKADEKALYVKNKAHPWGSAKVPQMLKFIDYYLTLNKVGFRSKVRLALGGAVFCAEHGKKGKAKSEEFREKAINYGVTTSKLDRLLGIPDIEDPL